MAKKEKKEVVEKATEQPKADEKVEKLKVKKPKMKKFEEPEDGIVKVDLKELAKKAEDVVKVDLSKPIEDIKVPDEKPIEEVKEQKTENPVEENIDTPVIEEITNEEEVKQVEEVVEQAVTENVETGRKLPEGVEKLMNFMNDTGGDINDYVKLNRDYSEMDNHTLLKEYYQQTKPHLQSDEVDFLMEDQFSYDEEIDEEKDIKRKKLALKEQVADAKAQLEERKSKYYEDIKAGSKLTSEQQKAIDFFNRHNKESENNQKIQKRSQDIFANKTENVFNKDFKGFEYNVGDKKYRFNVKDVNEVKETQSDMNNFVKKFLNKNNEMEDARGYHKSLFTAMNSDAVAKHFYEQGKADALKESVANSKNVNMDPRLQHSEPIDNSGLKFRVVGDSTDDFKFKFKGKRK
tara:strand:+ start:2084 stop:3298 length:1215 start_codon:yes stop_codon:yes gene_type:complete